MWLTPPKNTKTYNITANKLNDFTVEPLRRRLPSVTVLRHMCWTFSVRYNMYLGTHVFYLCLFCYLFIMLSN